MPFYDEEEDEDQPARRRCRHIFTAGRRCGSPCLRTQQFCYHHHTTRRPVQDPRARSARTGVFNLPEPEDREAVRAAVAQVMHAIAHNDIDLKRAGMLLYSLQIALCSFPPQPRPAPLKTTDNPIPLRDIPEDIVDDETHGIIALEDEYEPPPELKPRRSIAYEFLEEVERYEARQAAEAEQARLAAESAEPPLNASPPATQAQPEPPPAPLHRAPAIDLRAAAEPQNRHTTSMKRHPDPSLARTSAKRSRRNRGLIALDRAPGPPQERHADTSAYTQAPARNRVSARSPG